MVIPLIVPFCLINMYTQNLPKQKKQMWRKRIWLFTFSLHIINSKLKDTSFHDCVKKLYPFGEIVSESKFV